MAKKMKIFLVAFVTFCCALPAQSSDLKIGGKSFINHDYECVGLSSGQKAELTVSEIPGGASTVLSSASLPKPATLAMGAVDDQSRASRQYSFEFTNGSKEVLEIADITKMATVTMLNANGVEVYTSMICSEN